MDRRSTVEKVIIGMLGGLAGIGLLMLLAPFIIGALAMIGGFTLVFAPFLIPLGVAIFLGYFLGRRRDD